MLESAQINDVVMNLVERLRISREFCSHDHIHFLVHLKGLGRPLPGKKAENLFCKVRCARKFVAEGLQILWCQLIFSALIGGDLFAKQTDRLGPR